jgi:hypothetical protein
MSKVFYNYICELCGISGITPYNIENVREKLRPLSTTSIAREEGISREYLDKLKSLICSPRPSQRELLHKMYESGKEKKKLSGKELRKTYAYIPLIFLQMFQPPPVEKLDDGFVIYPEILKLYWPDIENFKDLNYECRGMRKKERRKARRGERIQEALRIMGKNDVSELSMEEVENLSRGDWKKIGSEISPASFHTLKGWLKKYAKK